MQSFVLGTETDSFFREIRIDGLRLRSLSMVVLTTAASSGMRTENSSTASSHSNEGIS